MFFAPTLNSFRHIDTNREAHHWCPKSEAFASASHLFWAVTNGWRTYSVVIRQRYYFAGARSTSIYFFELRRDHEIMTMPVQENPALLRLLYTEPYVVVTREDADTLSRAITSEMPKVAGG